MTARPIPTDGTARRDGPPAGDPPHRATRQLRPPPHVGRRPHRPASAAAVEGLLDPDGGPRRSLFFLVIPTILLLIITRIGDIDDGPAGVAGAADPARRRRRRRSRGRPPQGRTAYALAVYLFAPVAVVVPLTISTAVGAATLVGERERGTGEFLAHSPASVREIYLGKLLASFVPGYLTTLVGFGTLLAGRQPDRRPRRRRLVLPDRGVVGDDALDHPAVPAAHAVAGAAAVGPGEVDRRGPAGVGADHPAADRHRLRPGHRHPDGHGAATPAGSSARSPGCWRRSACTGACAR